MEPDGGLDLGLDELVCFALYAASRSAVNAYRDLLTPLGLTYPQYVTLLALWENDGATVSDLGERLHLDSGTLSPMLRRLQTMGLVERRRDRSDERRVSVHLTPGSRALRPRIAEVQRCLAASIDMSPHELATLRSLARRFCDAAGTDRSPSEGAST